MPGPTVAQLRRQCTSRGLPTSGKKAQLEARLRDHETSKKASTVAIAVKETSPSDSIDCLIATSISSDAINPINAARLALQHTIENDPLHQESMANSTVITNPRGSFFSHVAEDLAALKNDHAALKNDHAALKNDHDALKNDHTALKDDHASTSHALFARTDELERATVGFREFRHRFISTYKRDILNETDDNDRKFIQLGNRVVHSGNIKRDSELYSGLHQRHDPLVFRKLYGVLPAIAATIGKSSVLST
jgi:SAP domain